METDEPTEDEAFATIVAPYELDKTLREKLAQINVERGDIHNAIKHYSEYLDTLLPTHNEHRRTHGYVVYLVERLRDLNQREDTLLWGYFRERRETRIAQLRAHRTSPV